MSKAKERQPGFKDLQDIFKEISQKAAVDGAYRELCLKDAQAAIREVAGQEIEILEGIVFLAEDKDCSEKNGEIFILPPFIKESWLWSQKKE